MHKDTERHKQFSRRTVILAGGKLVLLSALVGRMYYLQVVESERYKTLADRNRINLRLLAPPRGRIVDRYGTPIAVNQRNYRVVLNLETTMDVEDTLRALGSIINIGKGERRRIMREIKRKPSFVPVTVRENLDWDKVARIEVNASDLPGVEIDEGLSRHYPFGKDTAHVLGYVASVSEKEVTGDPLLELPGFRIGKAGIEKFYDLPLRGVGGNSQVEVDALGRVIRELSRKEGQPGVELTLTIDVGLQIFVNRRLSGKSGAAVIMDVHTGDILALASTPGFDPNAFNKGLSDKEWNTLLTNPKAPLTNKVISGQFSPGSTYKMVVALAALAKGAIMPESSFFCSGSIKLGNAEFHCWKRGGHGTVQLAKGITQSCDVFFYEVAKRTGVDQIAKMARRLGFGRKLGLDLPNEHGGLIPTREWKRKKYGIPWQQGETLIAGIGQGYILTTPLQLVVMTARLVNGGFGVKPRLTAVQSNSSDPDSISGKDLGLLPEHLRIVREAMVDVVNSPRGTAFKARIKDQGFEMGGKTGTVQVRRITKAEREQGIIKNKDLPWKQRDHAMFVGFAPVNEPRYAAAVVIEHGGGGSTVAAPIARDILLEAQRRDGAPSGREAKGIGPARDASPGNMSG
jgi:penicillin-binding protein 2